MTRTLLSLTILTICMCASMARAEESAAGSSSTWSDPKTGLMWATKDNGASDTTYPQAVEYCQQLSLGGF